MVTERDYVLIPLTPKEIEWAKAVGTRRHREDQAAGLHDNGIYTHVQNDHSALDVMGCYGEIAIAHAMDYRYGMPADRMGAQDYGPYQIRTRRAGWHDLAIKPTDKPGEIYILLFGPAPNMYIKGWCTGTEAKQPKNWHPEMPLPCYLVTPKDLQPYATLPVLEWQGGRLHGAR